jgi:hypothetical protein
MIVIFIDNIEDFLIKLQERVMDDIFYEFRETKKKEDISSNTEIKIILHFLAKIENSLILYETNLHFGRPSTTNLNQEVINKIQDILNKAENSKIKLIKGKIREIFLSYSF